MNGAGPKGRTAAYAQARAILLDAADKMDATLARYAEVRLQCNDRQRAPPRGAARSSVSRAEADGVGA